MPGSSDQRPAAERAELGVASQPGEPVRVAAPAASDPGPDRLEPVAHDQPPGHPVPQAPVDVVGQAPRRRGQVGGEAGAPLPEHREHLGGGADGRLGRVADRRGPPPAASRGRWRNTTAIGVAFDGAAPGASASSARPGSEAEPGHLAVVAEPVEPARPVVAQPPGQQLRLPGRRPAASKPWSCSMTAPRPASPASWVPGATCCQRSRNRMKSWAVAGWTPLGRDSAGVAVHAGQQPAGHPLGSSASAPCSCPGGRTLVLEDGQGDRHPAGRQQGGARPARRRS